MRGEALTRKSYVRRLPYGAVRKLAEDLDVDNFWERMVEFIPKSTQSEIFIPRYTAQHVSIFARQLLRPNGSPTRSLLQDWGTQNCTLQDLLNVLEKAELMEAANYIKHEILNEPEEDEDEEKFVPELPIPMPLLPPIRMDIAPGNNPGRVCSPEDNKLESEEPTPSLVRTRPQPVQNDLSIHPISSLPSPPTSFDDKTLNHQRNYESLKPKEAECLPNVNQLDIEEKKQTKSADKHIEKDLFIPEQQHVKILPQTQAPPEAYPPDEGYACGYTDISFVAPASQLQRVPSDKLPQAQPPTGSSVQVCPPPPNTVQGSPSSADISQACRPPAGLSNCRPPPSPTRSQESTALQSPHLQSLPPQGKLSVTESGQTANGGNLSPVIQNTGNLQHVHYKDLADITMGFNEGHYSNGGRLIGKGGFGLVYLGIDRDDKKVAVKVLMENQDIQRRQFQVEVKTLSEHKHQNLVSLLGYSCDGEKPCIVFEYLKNGSLEDRLQCKNGSAPLPVDTRLKICRGSAHGVAYLNDCGIIHRDVKSANILLDENFVPKLGDFATARVGPSGSGMTQAETSIVIGTSAYLAPEAHHFDVSAKLDSYSFGVVILELLTGLPVYDAKREDKDLKSHMFEKCHDIMDMIDRSAGEWPRSTAEKLYEIASRCLTMRKKKRALVSDVLVEIDKL